MEWLRSSDLKDAGKPRLYRPQPGMLDVAADESARRESNTYLRNHEYSKPFPDGFQNVGGSNLIDATGEHHDPERPSVVLDQRPGADPALERFVKDMKAKYSHLIGDPGALAEALARESKAALEPKGWGPASVDDGYAKLRTENAGKRMLLGDFLEAAKFSKGAGVCNHQAMLTKVAFDSFYPADMPNRPEMKMVRGFYGDSPNGKPRDVVQNHARNTFTIHASKYMAIHFKPDPLIIRAKTFCRCVRQTWHPEPLISSKARLRPKKSSVLRDKKFATTVRATASKTLKAGWSESLQTA
jgi:hypothetical protein